MPVILPAFLLAYSTDLAFFSDPYVLRMLLRIFAPFFVSGIGSSLKGKSPLALAVGQGYCRKLGDVLRVLCVQLSQAKGRL